MKLHRRGKKEAWLINPGESIPSVREQFFCKVIGREPGGRVVAWRENPPMRFADLSENALLESGDLMRLFQVSRPTLARYLSKWNLRPSCRVGRAMFFKKRDVMRWWKKIGQEKDRWPLKVSLRVKKITRE